MIDPNDVLTGMFYILSSAAVALIGAWALLRRVKSQNRKDDVDAAREALQMVSDTVTKFKDLQDRVALLEGILNSGKYQVTLVARLGELPEIKSATIEKV